jgi:bacillithiol system protein YtxJ
MVSSLPHVKALDELEHLLASSHGNPLLLFKHSHTCGISAEALDELLSHVEQDAERVQYAIVTVQTHREVSNAISARLGVRHETPQAILVREGKAVWSASHFRVNAAELKKAIRNHS